MARGRPAVPKAPTKFMNKKHRVIMMTAEGKYVVKTDKGMAYNPVTRRYTLGDDTAVNYLVACRRPA